MQQDLYLDDLVVGQTFVTASHLLTAEEIVAFATAFDPQPFHLSDAGAVGTLFGSLAASGWHVAAISMRLLVAANRIAGGLLGAGAEIDWPRPTRPGAVLTVECEVIAVTPSRSRPDRGIVRMRNTTRNQTGEVVQVFTGKLVVPRRAYPPEQQPISVQKSYRSFRKLRFCRRSISKGTVAGPRPG